MYICHSSWVLLFWGYFYSVNKLLTAVLFKRNLYVNSLLFSSFIWFMRVLWFLWDSSSKSQSDNSISIDKSLSLDSDIIEMMKTLHFYKCIWTINNVYPSTDCQIWLSLVLTLLTDSCQKDIGTHNVAIS